MKCANETVTIELKNGKIQIPPHCSQLLRALANASKTRHHRARHYRLGLPPNEHGSARGEDDAEGTRPHISRHDQHPRLDDPLLHPTRLAATRQAAHR